MRKLRNSNVQLWIAQVFLALFFGLGSGLPKFILSPEALAANMPIALPQAFVLFIGTCEILGAVGLLWRRLTVLAAVCLAALTLCATTYQLLAQQPANAVFALAMGLICSYVALGRRRKQASPKLALA